MSAVSHEPTEFGTELSSDSSPIDPRDFRNALGSFATGVTVITAATLDGRQAGLTSSKIEISDRGPIALHRRSPGQSRKRDLTSSRSRQASFL